MIAEYAVQVQGKIQNKQSKITISKTAAAFLNQFESIDESCEVMNDDPIVNDMKTCNENLICKTMDLTVRVLSPVTILIWFYMTKGFRDHWDFNFQRPSNWNKDSKVLRFNDCNYVAKHQIFDWHSFALLKDNVMIHNGVVICHAGNELMFVLDVQYEIPNKLMHANSSHVFAKATKEDYKPITVVSYHEIEWKHGIYVIDDEVQEIEIEPMSDITIVDVAALPAPIFDTSGNLFVIENRLQHSDVQHNNIFFFATLGTDKYHHTQFSGKHDWDTHGVYWWPANANPRFQFAKAFTMNMAQVPNCVSVNTIGRIVWNEWNWLINEGILIWNGSELITVNGMISHQITDMQDRDHFMRRRASRRHSRCDGNQWDGFEQKCAWPDNVDSLLQLGHILPGPYILKIWKHVNHTLAGRNNFWQKFPKDYGKAITLTTETNDIYNEVPIASSLKCTIEINHTTLLGCVSDALKLEWIRMHKQGNLNENMTRIALQAFLNTYFSGINGLQSIAANLKTKMTVYNNMRHTWQLLIEILIALPTIVDWYGSIGLVTSLIRMTGALYNCRSENDVQRLKHIIKPILQQSLVI